MASSGFTAAQSEILRQLHTIIETARLDRIWIFEPHVAGSRESGLFVTSLFSASRRGGEMRELVTVRYSLEQQGARTLLEKVATPEGWAPPDRIERVMAGVLMRSGEQAGTPREETIPPDESWEDLLQRLAPPG